MRPWLAKRYRFEENVVDSRFAREVHLSSRLIECVSKEIGTIVFLGKRLERGRVGITIGGWSIKLEREMGSVNLLPI